MKQPRRPWILVFLAVSWTVPGRAEEPRRDAPPAVQMTLQDALDRARARSPRLAQLRALEEATAARARAERASRKPFVDLGAAYTRNSNVPAFSVSPGGPSSAPVVVFPNIPDRYESRLGLAVPLYTGGRIENAILAADRGRAAAHGDLEGGRSDLVLGTTIAYWSLVRAAESQRVLTDALASYDEHLKDAQDRLAVGMAARNEVLAVQVQRDQAELARLRAGRNQEIAHADLARLLDLEPGVEVRPIEPIDPPPLAEQDLETLVTTAIALRPERAALAARVEAAAARVKVQRADRRPQVRASAGFEYANPNVKFVPPEPEWDRSWDAGVSLAFTVFDGGRAAAAVAQAAAEAEAIQRELEDLDRQLRVEVTRSASDLALARRTLEVSERSVEAAEENVRVSRDRYREGIIPSSELLDAETSLLRAGLERTTARIDLRIALAGVDHACGKGAP